MNNGPNTPDNADAKPNKDQSGTDDPSNSGIVVHVEHAVIDSVNTQTEPTKTKHDWYDKIQLGLLALTFAAAFAAAVFTGVLAWLTGDLAQDSAKTLDASNRAYIAITGVEWYGEPKAGYNQRFKILFKNVGKSAADNFNLIAFVSPRVWEFPPDAKEMPYVDPAKVDWPPFITRCDRGHVDPNTIIIGQRPVYPDAVNEGILYGFNNPPYLPESVLNNRATFWITGCATYRSLGKPRWSPFCFYFQPARWREAKDGSFQWCPTGAGNAN